jgi:hypothetical protein
MLSWHAMNRSRHVVGSALALWLWGAPLAAQQPLPVDRSVVLKIEGAEYTVEGRVVIDRRFNLASQRAITIRGIGADPTLVVAGSFEAKAVLGGANRFENLTIELAPECRKLYLANVDWISGGGIRTAEGAPSSAIVFGEHLKMSSRIEVEMLAGSIDLQASRFSAPVVVRGLTQSERKPNATSVKLLTNKDGFLAGLEISGVADALVRHNLLAGPKVLLERVASFDLDGNLVRCDLLALRAERYTGFQKSKVRNCDFYGARVQIFAPAEGDKRLRLTMQHCWFRGLTDPEAILEQLVSDGTRNPECGVLASFTRISAQPLGLGGRPAD